MGDKIQSVRALEVASAMLTLGQTDDVQSMSVLYDELDEMQRKALTFFFAGMAFNALKDDAARRGVPLDEAIRMFNMKMMITVENVRSSGS